MRERSDSVVEEIYYLHFQKNKNILTHENSSDNT